MYKPKRDHRTRSSLTGMFWLSGTVAAMALAIFCNQALAESGSEPGLPIVISQMAMFGGFGAAVRILIFMAVLLLFPLKNLLATVYYVRKSGSDGNAGTSAAAAWATFAKATSSTTAGDVVYFGAGTYTEDVQPSVDGTVGSPIRFVGDRVGTMTGDAGDVTIVGSGGKGTSGISLDTDDYLEFEGFRITGSGKEGLKVKDSVGIELKNCEIYGSSDGIKVQGSTSKVNLINDLVQGNSSIGIECKEGTVTIWNCTIDDNTEEGVTVGSDKNTAAVTVTNSIVSNNGSYGLSLIDGTLTHTYNLVNGNTGGDYNGTTAGTGEISVDPKFEDSANDDYHLQDDSPAIDVGTDATGIVDDDLDGLFRPIGTTWDMGCYEECQIGPLLMVVSDDDSPSTQDMARLLLIQSFGYCVNLIDDDDSQANFDTALASNLVAYVSEEVDATSLSSKLAATTLGVVNEDAALTDEFGFSSSSIVSSQTSLSVINATHFITAPFIVGSYNIFDSSQPVVSLDGTVSTELQVIAQWGSASALSLLEIGALRHDTGTVPGRRVQLPWGGDSLDIDELNSDGQTIMQRAILWARGLAGYWTLDESSGTTAYDSSGYGNNGTLLGGLSFDSDSVSPAKQGDGLEFDGTGDYISITNDSVLQPTDAFSITAWIKGDAWSTGSNVNVIFRKGSDNPNNYQLAIADGKVTLYLDDSDTNGIQGDTTLTAGQWYHVAATWDGSMGKIYVDGVIDNDPGVTSLGPIGTDSRPVQIGGTSSGTDFFDGVIDDVRFYNYALDVTETNSVKGLGQPKGVRIQKWEEIK